MKKIILIGLIFLAIATANAAFSASSASNSVMVIDPYVRAVPPGQAVSAAFMQLENNSDLVRTIVDASSPISKAVELHSHIQEKGMMKMRRIETIEIPANDKTTLKPGGLHIMFIGLHKPLELDKKISLTLEFADGSKKIISAPVRKIKMQDLMHH